ncbi:flagellar biosynthetic protein FliR [Vibrio harveyi]|nr:flagellar biosynthetic protein FliR [Vibrio harveyi]
MLDVSINQLISGFGQIWWPFLRIGSMLMLMPILNGVSMPVQIRVIFTFTICIIVFPLMPEMPIFDPLSLTAVIFAIQEILIGFLFALSFEILFSVFLTMGQILATQLGLSMSIMNDPVNGISSASIGKYYQLYVFLIFLALDGHLIALDIIVNSYSVWGVGSIPSNIALSNIVNNFSWMLCSATLLALPAIISMLIVNIAFGVMNRASPQLNIFSLGFPMTMILGLISLLITVSGISDNFIKLFHELIEKLSTLEVLVL